jgi:DNA-binding NarL/FixJ family response regulator
VRHVLIVDDAADCLSTLEVAMGSLSDTTVIGAGSAEEAMDILNSRTVSGVITDLELPEMSGLDLIAHIRGAAKTARLPIVVVSADTDPATPEAALRLGANAFFSKPFSPSAVRKKLEELIHGSSQA